MTKLKLSFLLICIFSIIHLSAQDTLSVKKDSLKKPRSQASFLAFDLGGNLPLGKFAQNGSLGSNSGFASSGFSYRVELAIIGRKNFGFGGMYGGFTNYIDASAFGANSNLITSIYPISYSAIGERGNYFSEYYYVGPIITLPLKNVFIDFKTMFGLMSTVYPNFGFNARAQALNQSTDLLIIGEKANAVFAYNIGTNIRLKLSKAIQFKTTFEFMYAKPEVRYTISGSGEGHFRQAISVLNITWGLAFKLE